MHPVFHVHRPADVEVARCYLRHVARLGAPHGFGFVGEKAGKSMQHVSGDRAAAYLSSYFVRGRGTKATLQENARNPHLPRMLIWVSPNAGAADGSHDAESPALPAAVGSADGNASPPSWSGVELAQIVVLAGEWPARGP